MYAKDHTTIIDRREMLRVKARSLAVEARLIRRQELRTHGVLRAELYQHRTSVVRDAARATHLALGFIRGRTLEQMEPTRTAPTNWFTRRREEMLAIEVRKMIKKYGPKTFIEPEWLKETARVPG